MTLYIKSASDLPHARHRIAPAQTVCHKPLIGMRAITEKQALVWLGDRRCGVCFPGWTPHATQGWRAAA